VKEAESAQRCGVKIRGEEADSEGTRKASVASILNFDMRDVPPDTGGTGGCPG
jgi:hypothetical protein